MDVRITLQDIEDTIKALKKPGVDFVYVPQAFYKWLNRKSRTWKDYKKRAFFKKIFID